MYRRVFMTVPKYEAHLESPGTRTLSVALNSSLASGTGGATHFLYANYKQTQSPQHQAELMTLKTGQVI